MKVRKAVAKDASAIRALVKANRDTLVQHHVPKVSEFFVAVEKRVVVGCCALVVYSKRLAEIRTLAVLPEFRGEGIATKLVNACVATAKKKKIYELLAITGAVKFFNKAGFVPFHKEKFALLRVLGN